MNILLILSHQWCDTVHINKATLQHLLHYHIIGAVYAICKTIGNTLPIVLLMTFKKITTSC